MIYKYTWKVWKKEEECCYNCLYCVKSVM
jgi:hypothetical protein